MSEEHDEQQTEETEENEETEQEAEPTEAEEASDAEDESSESEQPPAEPGDQSDEAQEEEEDQDQEKEQEQDQQPQEQPAAQSDGDGNQEFEESVVHVNRCCKVVQGGKQFSFSALIVAGNRNGKLSYGFGKANQVPQAIQKAIQDSRRRVIDVPIVHGTIPHRVELEYCSTKLLMRPASPGTGVLASLPVRTSVNLAGITDLLTKIYGSTNPINCVKAVYEGLKSLRTKEEIEDLRGVKIG